jgi:tRNA(Ile2) C34 agmatinyltransferase TiaS
VEAVLSPPQIVVAIAVIVLGLGVLYGAQKYQRCPHCGRIVRRAVTQGWLRCPGCGRQYRKGLRVR